MFRILSILLLLAAGMLQAAPQSNILVYDGGATQVSSDVDGYDQIAPGTPIKGSIMVTHDKRNIVNMDSFRLGSKPLKAEFVQSAAMDENLEVSIYRFQLEGMPAGNHTLPPIHVTVGGKDVQAPPLMIEVDSK